MAITVTATGNHYFVDSIAGATAALAAVTLVALYRRSRTSASGVRQARIEPAAA
jgi:membrane-associated phospholipid phosphatase